MTVIESQQEPLPPIKEPSSNESSRSGSPFLVDPRRKPSSEMINKKWVELYSASLSTKDKVTQKMLAKKLGIKTTFKGSSPSLRSNSPGPSHVAPPVEINEKERSFSESDISKLTELQRRRKSGGLNKVQEGSHSSKESLASCECAELDILSDAASNEDVLQDECEHHMVEQQQQHVSPTVQSAGRNADFNCYSQPGTTTHLVIQIGPPLRRVKENPDSGGLGNDNYGAVMEQPKGPVSSELEAKRSKLNGVKGGGECDELEPLLVSVEVQKQSACRCCSWSPFGGTRSRNGYECK